MKEKVKYQISLKNEHYKTQCETGEKNVMWSLFASFIKTSGKKGGWKLSLSGFN